MNQTVTTRLQWVDCAKFVAILCVLIDHTCGILYVNPAIQFASFCSVGMFILIAGYTQYQSAIRKQDFGYSGLWRRIHKILLPYLLAVFVIQIMKTGHFDWADYWKHVVCFNISGPHYYVFLYIQMLIAAPILINALRTNRLGSTVITVLVVLAVAAFTTNRSSVLNIYGGGGRLFGGTYLILLLLGIIFAKYDLLSFSKQRQYLVGLVLTATALTVWWQILCRYQVQIDSVFPFGVDVNPPGICMMLQCLLVLLLIYFGTGLLESLHMGLINRFLRLISWIGQRTLYIFLYHMVILEKILIPCIPDNLLLKRIVFLPALIVLPILWEWAVQSIKHVILPLMDPPA